MKRLILILLTAALGLYAGFIIQKAWLEATANEGGFYQ